MSSEVSPGIAILSSMIGYGTIIPAILLYQRLEQYGASISVQVIEDTYPPAKLQVFNATKRAFQKDPRLARVAAGMTTQFRDNTDKQQKEQLFSDWRSRGVRRFVVFSGLWSGLLTEYAADCFPGEISVVYCKVDSGFSAVWPASHECSLNDFFDVQQQKVNFRLGPGYLQRKRLAERGNHLVIHGGGWDIGDFADIGKSIPATFDKQLVIVDDTRPLADKNEFLIVRQAYPWNPLNNREDLYRLPSYEIEGCPCPVHMGLYPLLDNCQAIISKPGGMTLMDSLSTASPLIMLKAAGANEADNFLFWKNMGFGISFDDWKELGFSTTPLELIQERLLHANDTIVDYVDHIRSIHI